MAIAFPLVVVACSGTSTLDGEFSGSATVAEQGVETTSTTVKLESDVAYPNTWVDVPAPEGCVCADGKPFSFKVRDADPSKLLIVLSEGPFCYAGRQCSFIPPFGNSTFWEGVGAFDFTNSENPFVDYSTVFVPNCTLDGLVGDYVAQYLQVGMIHHTGHRNASSIVTWAASRYPNASIATVVGLGSGGFAAPLMAGLTSALLPRADISLIIDSHGATPDSFAGITSAWAFLQTFHPVADFSSLTYETLTMTSALEVVSSSYPKIRTARVNFADDPNVRREVGNIGYEYYDMREVLIQGEQSVEAKGTPVATWIAPGMDHIVLDGSSFFDLRFGQVRLVRWLSDFLPGESVDDQVCSIC
jgi:hypothetical protein